MEIKMKVFGKVAYFLQASLKREIAPYFKLMIVELVY